MILDFEDFLSLKFPKLKRHKSWSADRVDVFLEFCNQVIRNVEFPELNPPSKANISFEDFALYEAFGLNFFSVPPFGAKVFQDKQVCREFLQHAWVEYVTRHKWDDRLSEFSKNKSLVSKWIKKSDIYTFSKLKIPTQLKDMNTLLGWLSSHYKPPAVLISGEAIFDWFSVFLSPEFEYNSNYLNISLYKNESIDTKNQVASLKPNQKLPWGYKVSGDVSSLDKSLDENIALAAKLDNKSQDRLEEILASCRKNIRSRIDFLGYHSLDQDYSGKLFEMEIDQDIVLPLNNELYKQKVKDSLVEAVELSKAFFNISSLEKKKELILSYKKRSKEKTQYQDGTIPEADLQKMSLFLDIHNKPFKNKHSVIESTVARLEEFLVVFGNFI
jgi:hypothetical protein